MIDKSLRQYYQTGKEVDPYRKGLEIIAGKGKDTIQTTAPGKITARNLIKPAEKMTLPSVRKDKTVPSITTLPKTARPSFDQKKYSGLASAFYDKLKEGEESYLDKYINRDPVRTAGGVEEWGEDYDYLTSSAAPEAGIDTALAPLATAPKVNTALTALAASSGDEATSYNDTQIQNILNSDDQETKSFLTKTLTKTKEAVDKITKTGGQKAGFLTKQAKGLVKSAVAKQLGIGSMFGPLGLLFSWAFDKIASKITGKDLDSPVNAFVNKTISKFKDGDDGKEDIDVYGFDVSGDFRGEGLTLDEWEELAPSEDYGFNVSGDFTGEGLTTEELDTMDSPGPSEDYGFDDSGDFTGEGLTTEELDTMDSPASSAPTHYDEPSWSGDSGSSDSGSSDSGSSDSGGWGGDWDSYIAKGGLAQRAPRKSMLKGGRVDKALGGRMDRPLTGRSRDI